MTPAGFIMLYRQLVHWEWYSDVNTCKLFLHCLLKMNYSKKRWQGNVIDKCEFITSYEKLAVETGLTVSKVRTALSKLESTQNVSIKTTSAFTKIRVLNMKDFVLEAKHEQNSSPNDTTNDTVLTIDSQTDSNQIATTITNNNLLEKIRKFREEVFSHSNYDVKILESFFNYWSELNSDNTKMRKEDEAYFELAKRLKKWAANERSAKTHNISKTTLISNR